MKSAVHTPVILSSVPNNSYDDLHYDSRQVGNLCIPYDPSQTVTLQTPVVTYSERSSIVSLTCEYHPISPTPLLELTTNIYDPRRQGSCMTPYSPTGNNNVFSTIPLYVSTPKLSNKMKLMTLYAPTAQCQSPYSPGNAKMGERNNVASMIFYNPSTTAQSLSLYSPGYVGNGKIHTYIPSPKTILSSRNLDKLVFDDLMKLINRIIKDIQERKQSYLSQCSESSKNLKLSCRHRLSSPSEIPFCQILPAKMTTTAHLWKMNHLMCQGILNTV